MPRSTDRSDGASAAFCRDLYGGSGACSSWLCSSSTWWFRSWPDRGKVLHLITEVNPFLLLLGVGLEAASLLSYAELARTVLPEGRSISIFTMLRVQMATLSVSHCAPGGSATGTALGYRLLTQSGVPSSDVGFGLATQAIGSAVVLNVVLWVALVVSIPVWGFSGLYLLAAAVGFLLLVSSAGLVAAFTPGGEPGR